jgi:hypothetical protein
MIYELRVYRVRAGPHGGAAYTLRASNLADNGPPWHGASRVPDDKRWSLGTTPHLSACMGVACTAARTVGCVESDANRWPSVNRQYHRSWIKGQRGESQRLSRL